METKLRARDQRIANCDQHAVKAFANHQITQRLSQDMFRSWRCQEPGTWTYGFDVTTTPGRLIISGDIGFLAVERTNDMIAWSRGSVNSIEYFAEKVPREIPVLEFDELVARQWIEDEISEERAGGEPDNKVIEKWMDLLGELGDANEHQFSVSLYESRLIDGGDWPTLTNWKMSFLWCREALMWFLANLKE